MFGSFSSVFLTKLTVGAYFISAVTAVLSDAIGAAAVAGAFGLMGISLQLASSARQSRMERNMEQARLRNEHTKRRVAQNSSLLEERKQEVERLSRRVEQLITILISQGHQAPDERLVDAGPPGGVERRKG